MESSTRQTLWHFHWRRVLGSEARRDQQLLAACAELYSSSYGVWSTAARGAGLTPGERIRRAPEDIAELLESPESFLAVAELPSGELVGYCVAVFTPTAGGEGRIAWVSQLVVGEAYRNAGVATNLLFSVWGFSDHYACGLVTSNPFAVRALESATRRACRLAEIRRRGNQVLQALQGKVSYLPSKLQNGSEHMRPVVDTQFFVSHEELERMRRNAARESRPWALGDIDEGEEWFACTFRDQEPAPLSAEKLNDILVGADRVWMEAFARMTLGREHAWHRFAPAEVDFILDEVELPTDAAVLDLGCGEGRHAVLLAERGYRVTGIDVVRELINRARSKHGESDRLSFHGGDSRDLVPHARDRYELVLLLYDVLGASGSRDDDLRTLRNIAAVLSPDGRLVLSVMNAGAVVDRIPAAHLPDSDRAFARALEDLPPSNTMESTGDIFNPDLLLHYGGTFYRKEQFELGHGLPSELVVRDLRYRPEELGSLMEHAGFEVELLRPVQAGKWRRRPELDTNDQRAKELLVIARTRLRKD